MPSEADAAMCEEGVSPNLATLRPLWAAKVAAVLEEATLVQPSAEIWMQKGGKQGKHSEYLGYILADMQYMQRTYPNAKW